jgi:hypothetical protein
MTTITGYKQDNTGSWISKDPSAQLVYTMDWSQWLPQGDAIVTATYSLQVRANDPTPLIKVSEGTQDGVRTYVEVSGGGVNKTYTITCAITTTNSLTDTRFFRIKVENRSA